MARVICLLFSLLYVFQAFAAPLNGRVFLGRRVNAGWSDTNDQLSGRILSARASLAKINSIDSSDFQPGANSITKNHFLNAQFSLLSASRIADKVTDKIALAALNGKEPARDNAHRLILSGLSDAQNTLSTVSAFEIVTGQGNTTENLHEANAFVAQAMISAQQAVALNCTKIVAEPFTTTAGALGATLTARQVLS